MPQVDFRNIATASMRSDLVASDKHCVFRSGATWYSLPAISVREITIAPPMVNVPLSHPALAGLCHLRSEFIPVLLLSTLLEIEDQRITQSNNKLMVMNGTSSTWALLIAEAAALESLETIMSPESRLDDSHQSPVMGTAMFHDQIVRVLDPNRLFRLAQQTLDTTWSRRHSATASNLS